MEGWFWPDTWMYTANTTDVALLKRAHQKMVKAVDTVWEGRADGLPYQDKNQLVTMASIIEKETAVASERDQVASVFINRLRIGMRLQTDPTVIYGMGTRYNGKLSRVDLDTPTAYNTYTITDCRQARLPCRERLHCRPRRIRQKRRISILWLTVKAATRLTPILPAITGPCRIT